MQKDIKKFQIKDINRQRHSFHLVDNSPWPFIGALGAFFLTSGVVTFSSYRISGSTLLTLGFISILISMYKWWSDIIREGYSEGQHTLKVQRGLRLGFILFVVSEVMFFFGFFWCFIDAGIKPSFSIGCSWPPSALGFVDPWNIPLANTCILLASGGAITWSHHWLIEGNTRRASLGIALAIFLAIVFTSLQVYEYIYSTFSISDGIFSSAFFLATGFHGFHVFVGTCFLTVCFFRINLKHFSLLHHIGIEAAFWYWHFVDIVWLYLFLLVYWWPSPVSVHH